MGVYGPGGETTNGKAGQTDAGSSDAGLANSAYGVITGGSSGTKNTGYDPDNNTVNGTPNGGDLCGGHEVRTAVAGSSNVGGSSTVGGGGGGVYDGATGGIAIGGRGGAGLVLIQYLPW